MSLDGEGYFYTTSDKGLWVNLYGSNQLKTKLSDGSVLSLSQQTDDPWDGKITIKLEECPTYEFSIFLRVPGWATSAEISVNSKKQNQLAKPGTYTELTQKWKKGDQIELLLPMEAQLIEANPLVEEDHNQIAVKRGPANQYQKGNGTTTTGSVLCLGKPWQRRYERMAAGN